MNAETDLVRLLPTWRHGAPPVTLDPHVLGRNFVTGFGPRTDQVHPFFMIRSNLLRHIKASGQQIIAVTSAEPGNGKTHTAINLAAVLGRITPTVLIELDLHRPSIAARLGLPADPPGVDDYLQGQAEWHETRLAIEGCDLAIHRVRKPRCNAEGLLNSPGLASAMARLRDLDSRPVCIIDTPPALISDDLALIARVVDGFLVVAEEARTRKRALSDLVNALGSTPVIGSVLNKSLSETVRSDGYGYYYGKDSK